MENLRSTTVHHDVRRKFRLTVDEYCLADSIYRLSNGNYPWCKVEKKVLGKSLDMSERSVYRKLEKLVKKGLVEMGQDGLRTTELWRNNAEFIAKVAKKSAKVAEDFAKVATPSIYNSSTNSGIHTEAVAKATAVTSFSLEETLKKWESGSVRRMEILAWYFRKARFIARTKKELDNLIHRHIRAATRLEAYTDKELVSAWEKSEGLGRKLNFDPTLETVLKQLTQ